MHVVADDCALPRDKGITGRRGVAGTVLVAKVAGAAAEAGLSLEEVRDSNLLASSLAVEPRLCPYSCCLSSICGIAAVAMAHSASHEVCFLRTYLCMDLKSVPK